MLDQVRSLVVFVRVVEEGSFRKAATGLNLSPAVVSHHVSLLEDQLRTALLYRSTRKLALTAAGEQLMAAAGDLLKKAESALAAAAAAGDTPAGEVRVTMPIAATFDPVTTHMSEFVDRHPLVRLNATVDDRYSKLIEDGHDLALRIGPPEQGALEMRRLHYVPRALVASAGYVGGRPPPETPDDLKSWRWIRFAARPMMADFMHPRHGAANVWGLDAITTDCCVGVMRFAMSGAGLGVLPRCMVERELAAGALVEVLPEWRLRPRELCAVWPPNIAQSSLTLRLVEFLTSRSLELSQLDETRLWAA